MRIPFGEQQLSNDDNHTNETFGAGRRHNSQRKAGRASDRTMESGFIRAHTRVARAYRPDCSASGYRRWVEVPIAVELLAND